MHNPDAFERALAIVLRLEGVLSDDPDDPGGLTKHGVSIRFAGSIGLDLDGDGDTDAADMRALTRAAAAELYRDHFWNRLNCDALPYGLALALFDAGVNQGPRPAARLLQRAAGAVADGFIGPITIAAVTRATGRHALLDDFLARRAKRYAATANFGRYGRGWMRRLFVIHRSADAALYN